MDKIKELVYNQLKGTLDKQIAITKETIASLKESRDGETKSSVGDKYETGRAMMQLELEKHEAQLGKAADLKNILGQIDLGKKHDKVEFGSLVITNQGNHFISIGAGKVVINNENYYAISLASPIGQILQGKKIGDAVQFQGREFIIKKIA